MKLVTFILVVLLVIEGLLGAAIGFGIKNPYLNAFAWCELVIIAMMFVFIAYKCRDELKKEFKNTRGSQYL